MQQPILTSTNGLLADRMTVIWSDPSLHRLIANRLAGQQCYGETHPYINRWLVDWQDDSAIEQLIFTSTDGQSTSRATVLWSDLFLFRTTAYQLIGWWCYGATHLYIDQQLIGRQGNSAIERSIFIWIDGQSTGKVVVERPIFTLTIRQSIGQPHSQEEAWELHQKTFLYF